MSRTPSAIQNVEARRREAGITVEKLCAAADVSTRGYEYAVHEKRRLQARTIKNLQRALSKLTGNADDMVVHGQGVFTIIQPTMVLVSREMNVPLTVVRAANPKERNTSDPEWMRGARVRFIANYLVNTALGIPQAALARAYGVSAAAICQQLQKIEDERDDNAELDQLLDRLTDDLVVA